MSGRRLGIVRCLLAAGAGLLASCAGPSGSDVAATDGRPRIVCTVGMVTDIVRRVAGDRAEVIGLIGAGVDPHLYKPTRDDVEMLSKADIIFYAGLMLEGKMADTLVKVGRSRKVYAVTEEIDDSFLLHPDGAEGHADPHVWMDGSAWAECVKVVARALSEFDPLHAADYARRGDALIADIMAMHEYGKRVISTIPERSRVLITSHDAFNYFGRAYGLRVEGVQGLSTESEAGLKRINDLVDFIVKHEVRAVFIETSVSPRNIQALIEGARSRGHAVVIGGELFSDAMGEEGTYEGTYLGMLDHNLTIVARALGGEAPAAGCHGKLSHASR